MKLRYFAWLRQKIGRNEETLQPPSNVTNVRELLDWLEALGPGYQAALADRKAIRVAINQDYVGATHPVRPDDEVALFPPVTGG